MAARRVTPDDVDWVVDRLARRRARLARHAPLYWRAAPDAEAAHRHFLGHVIGAGGGIGFRTEDAVLIAVPGRGGEWTVDDADVADGGWTRTGTGQQMWEALRREVAGSGVRFVCPTPEPDRLHFAQRQGLRLQTSWWHRPIRPIRPPVDGGDPHVDGATATMVRAPRIYDPGGPILFVTGVEDTGRVLRSARAEAERLGSPIVVVDQPPADSGLGFALDEAGFYRHCDFLAGPVT